MERLRIVGGAVAVVLSMSACGFSKAEMAAKQREIDKLVADLGAAKTLHEADVSNLTAAESEIGELRRQLGELGEMSSVQKDALANALLKAEQLQAIEQRFRDLRSRLEKLATVGVQFVVRNNRMVIQLPGDILFGSGSDQLRVDGLDILTQIADVIRADPGLASRTFQVAGHTDNAVYPPSGPFKDNWGLSLARARQVVLFLTAPTTPPGSRRRGGGGLDPARWSAAGYGKYDPIDGTVDEQTIDQRTRNRRVELVLEPNVDEMLDLTKIK